MLLNNSSRIGTEYEQKFQTACLISNVAYYRLPSFGAKFTRKRIQKQQIISDYIIAIGDKLMIVDVKETSGKQFNYSMINSVSTAYQYKEMCKLNQQAKPNKITSGFFVFYSAFANRLVFYTAEQFYNVIPRSSLNATDGLFIGERNKYEIRKAFSIKWKAIELR